MKIRMIVVFGLLMALLSGCAGVQTEQPIPPTSVTQDVAVDLSGYWKGLLEIGPGKSLPLGFTIRGSADGLYEALMQIPSQGLRNFKVSSVQLEGTLLTIGIDALQASFSGSHDPGTDQIVGTFTQMGQSLPLVLALGEIEEYARPQDPQKPYPYLSEEIRFTQAPEGFQLAGTLTRPEGDGPFPAVVLVTGSGSQNRDEELLGHKPFLVLSDALTRAGIVVLRYDDRGFAESQGDASAATSLDFADDASSAVEYLKALPYVDSASIGLIGHSEGGIIGPIVAQKNKDLDFLVLMAGPGVNGLAVLEDQTAAILRAQHYPEPVIAQIVQANLAIYNTVLDEREPLEERKESVMQTLLSVGMSADEAEPQMAALFSPWYMKFLTLNPADYLKGLTIPALILNGTKDTQVSATLHVPAIEEALLSGGSTRFTSKIYEGLNHLFQPATTGSPDEYESIETTIDPQVLQDIATWIVKERTLL